MVKIGCCEPECRVFQIRKLFNRAVIVAAIGLLGTVAVRSVVLGFCGEPTFFGLAIVAATIGLVGGHYELAAMGED